MPEMNQAQAIREATRHLMIEDPTVVLMGEGVADPKGVFGTTEGLVDIFGSKRVIETPLCENAFTGAAIGMALNGFKPIVTHQRVDFSLLSLDQIINNAAKWYYMFGGQQSVPIVIRMIIGRGWGQGAQHSQSLQALFSHINGIKVVMPVFASEGAGLLHAAVKDPNPVIMIEHRWCHYVKGQVCMTFDQDRIGEAIVVKKGVRLTLVATSYMVLEALNVAEILYQKGIDVEVINLRTIQPWDEETVYESVRKTGHLVVLDTGGKSFGVGGEIVASVCENCWKHLKARPIRISCPDYPSPSSPFLAKDYYPSAEEIFYACLKILDLENKMYSITWPQKEATLCDKPNPEFQGPF